MKKRRTKKSDNRDYAAFSPTPVFCLEVGGNFSRLVDQEGKGSTFLYEFIPMLRGAMKHHPGITIPSIKTAQLDGDGDAFVVRLRDREVLRGRVPPGHIAVAEAEEWVREHGIDHENGQHPIYGSPLLWIPARWLKAVLRKKIRCWTVEEYLVLELARVVRSHYEEFLTLPDVYALVESVRKSHPTFVGDLYNGPLKEPASMAVFADCLKLLVGKGYCIRDLHLILEAVVRCCQSWMKAEKWAELIIAALKLTPDKEWAGIPRVPSELAQGSVLRMTYPRSTFSL